MPEDEPALEPKKYPEDSELPPPAIGDDEPWGAHPEPATSSDLLNRLVAVQESKEKTRKAVAEGGWKAARGTRRHSLAIGKRLKAAGILAWKGLSSAGKRLRRGLAARIERQGDKRNDIE